MLEFEDYIPAGQIVDIDKSNAISNTGATASQEVVTKFATLRYEAIPAQYWGGLRWMMDQSSFAVISRVVDGFGRPLFQPFMNATPASSLEVGTIMGLPVYVGNNLGTSAAAGDTCAILAHAEDYSIFDRAGFSASKLTPTLLAIPVRSCTAPGCVRMAAGSGRSRLAPLCGSTDTNNSRSPLPPSGGGG